MPSSASRPTPAQFRRRRWVAGILAVLFVAGLAFALGGLVSRLFLSGDDGAPASSETSATTSDSGSAAPTPDESSATAEPSAAESSATASGSASSTAEPTSSPSPSSTQPTLSAPACQDTDIRLTAGTDRPQYGANQMPVLALRVMNMGADPCTLNVGTKQQEFVVATADGEEVFSTRTCQADAQDQDMVLVPNDEQTAVFTWFRRNDAASCDRRGPGAEDGSYRLTVSLGDMTSQPVAFRISMAEVPEEQ